VTPETRPTLNHFTPAFVHLKERFRVLGHGHPRLYGIERDYRRAGIEYVPEFADVCRRADVYVCDNSSTLYEFAATGRPVVVLNGPGYRRDVHHGLRFWEAADVGIQVDHPRDLPDAVAEALSDPPKRRRAREAALDLVYAHRSGAAERAAEAIVAFMDERLEAAA
jgi:UDP-N-acetylglucosamine:LPS N-acetylglucosamine transferase